ncbi:MAG: hypothetical protein IJQ12_07010 [Lachnospiraceae bacterium]|nr:hypothetical protein [Lachnospiraceae bacterium]
MRAVYDRVHDLPGYEGIRDAVEYEILQMYSYGINNCVQAGQQRAVSQQERDRMLAELKDIRMQTVRIRDYRDNPYVMRKIPEADRRQMRENDR